MLGLTDKQLWAVRRRRHVKLTPEQAKALRPGTVRVNRHLWMEVRGAKRDKKAGWYVDYVVCDHRPRFMKRGTGHTHTVELAVAREDEDVVPKEYQLQLTMEAHRRQESFDRANRADGLAARDVQRLNAEIRELVRRAMKMGIDPAVALAPVLSTVKRQHASLRDAA